ncbi:hypothetical protein ABZ137_33950 [Streptomyces bobili]|uniref:hypothetical protein n=1 Tax=Streptomyces bobili TaxID=67280 RepID=UPI0033B1B4AA
MTDSFSRGRRRRRSARGGQHQQLREPGSAGDTPIARSAPEYKAKILAEYETLGKQGKGALLRREGLYWSLITNWRQQRDKGAEAALPALAG